VGMRGEADTAIMQNATLKDNIDLLRDVIRTQNSLIKQYVNEDVQQVPRMLALYKEVEPYFYGDKKTKGLMDDPELDGVTLMLCDDNHGNLRTVPTAKMRSHKGGYGMYYHFDYHGSPFSFEWINSTALPKVKEQMCAAYDFGIQDLWIVNVGDVMTNEFPLNYFLDLAYDYEKYSDSEYTTDKWTKEWVEFNFPSLSDEQKSDVKFIIDTYTQLSHLRRPECLQPDTYHPVNYGESDYMLKMAEAVIAKAEKLKAEACSTGLYAQVIYPALGTMNVLRMQLYSGKNKWFASHGCIAANEYAGIVQQCYNYDKALVDEYDKVADGKFYGEGWSEHFGFLNWCEAASRYPTYTYVEPTRKGRLVAFVEGNAKTTTGQDWTDRNLYVDAFKNPDVKETAVYIAQCGKDLVDYKITFKNDEKDRFVEVSKAGMVYGYGKTQEDSSFEKLTLTINREKAAKAASKKDTMIIEGTDGHGAGIKVFVEIDAEVPQTNYPKGTYVQTGDVISIPAVNYAASEWKNLPDYRVIGAVKAYPVIESYPKGKAAPAVEYHFVPKTDGVYAFDFYLNPSNPAYKDNKLQFIAEINGEKLLCDVVDSKNFAVGDHQEPWGQDVTNNCRISTVYADCKNGMNVLKVYPVTPNVVLEKIEISEADVVLRDSYLGSPETYRVK
ncbi:MAG: glycosyl hydrolase 115 family protein, partial [Treponema sp.]|nr:glycosyl hydrolase 115 family protein [Treponema sp.]